MINTKPNVSFENFIYKGPAQNAVKLYLDRLMQVGYGDTMRSPTYHALGHYKKDLFWEDVYYKYFKPETLMLFKEAGELSKFVPNKNSGKFKFFSGLLTDGEVSRYDFERYVGEDILTRLSELNLLEKDAERVALAFRIVPTPYGPILADTYSKNPMDDVHIGLDSVLFWDFLKSERKAITRCKNALNLGCGSGMHSLLLKNINPGMKNLCVDINDRCLSCSKANMVFNNVDSDMQYLQSNWFEEVKKLPEKKYDLIICNPPFEWQTDAETELQNLCSYGGEYGMESTRDVLKELPYFLDINGKGYVLTQSIVTENGRFLIVDEIIRNIKELTSSFNIAVRILYEHLLTEEAQMKNMLKNSFSHFAIVVIEITPADALRENITVIDERPWLKRISDKRRVKACRSYWKDILN